MEMQNEHHRLVTTARITGMAYLILAIAGGIGFMVLHPQVYIAHDPQKTLANLVQQESAARMRLVFELLLVASQAIAALGFYQLFRGIKDWAAWGIGVWGSINAVAIMVSAIAMGAAIEIATSDSPSMPEKTVMIHLLSGIITQAWAIGSLFFGLWLLPMGFVVTDTNRMPVGLGWTLMIGGLGYIVSAFGKCFGWSDAVLDLLPLPATVGEFWMIGYLLSYGIRPSAPSEKIG